MRKTVLKRTTAALTGFLIIFGTVLGVLRVQRTGTAAPVSGQALFQEKGCSQCHFTDSTKTKMGPGLKGLFDREKLPASGRKATAANVREQLISPYRNMPSFADRLTPEQKERIINYLKTL